MQFLEALYKDRKYQKDGTDKINDKQCGRVSFWQLWHGYHMEVYANIISNCEYTRHCYDIEKSLSNEFENFASTRGS